MTGDLSSLSGMNIKELVLSYCRNLTGVGVVGQTCRLGVASRQHSPALTDSKLIFIKVLRALLLTFHERSSWLQDIPLFFPNILFASAFHFTGNKAAFREAHPGCEVYF